MSVIVALPVRVPLFAGVSVTLITHLAPGATVPPFTQVVPLASAKSEVMDTVEMLSVEVPVFVSVTDFAALVVPLSLIHI